MPPRSFVPAVLLAVLTAFAPASAPATEAARLSDMAEPVVLNTKDDALTADTFRLIAGRALLQRNWRIIASEPTRIVGTLTKRNRNDGSDTEYRVEVAWTGETIVIGFVPGFHSPRPNWLRNLEKDIDIELQLRKIGAQ